MNCAASWRCGAYDGSAGPLRLLDAVVREGCACCRRCRCIRATSRALRAAKGMPRRAARSSSRDMYHLHHDPGLYPSPQALCRALPAQQAGSVRVQPRWGGPRMCIGAAFATLEIKIALCADPAAGAHRDRAACRAGLPRRDHHGPAPWPKCRLHPPDGRWAEDAGGIRGGDARACGSAGLSPAAKRMGNARVAACSDHSMWYSKFCIKQIGTGCGLKRQPLTTRMISSSASVMPCDIDAAGRAVFGEADLVAGGDDLAAQAGFDEIGEVGSVAQLPLF